MQQHDAGVESRSCNRDHTVAKRCFNPFGHATDDDDEMLKTFCMNCGQRRFWHTAC